MAEFRGGITVAGEVSEAAIGALLDLLTRHDGAIAAEDVDRLSLVFSFDASVPAGFAPGLAAAMPRLLDIGRTVLHAAGLDAVEVIGLSLERVTS